MNERNAFAAVQDLADSWILPTHVGPIEHLDPGTWLVAEVNGSVAANIGVQYGLDFNWVRDVEQLGLSGDIGLRLQLGLEASLGFSARGKYAVVLGRESSDAAAKKSGCASSSSAGRVGTSPSVRPRPSRAREASCPKVTTTSSRRSSASTARR